MWIAVKDGDPGAYALYERHYSARQYKDNRHRCRAKNLFVGPGYKLVYVTQNYDALFVWRKFKDDSGEVGINCAVFRNESPYLSSEMILEAEKLAWAVWPDERLYTYVDGKKVHGDGACFKHAGWRKLKRRTKSGKIILEKLPAEARDAFQLEPKPAPFVSGQVQMKEEG